MELSAEDKLRKARVQLQKDNPFFGYLVLHLKLVEKTSEEGVDTAAVDYNGKLYFNSDFIDDLTLAETKGLVCHEVMHLALEGKMRKGARKKKKWNAAQDIVINHIVKQNGLDLPENGLIPDNNGNYNKGDIKITDLDNHSFESVYDLIPDQDEGGSNSGQGDGEDGDGDDDGDENPQGFDDHIYEGNEDSGQSTGGGGQDEKDWARTLAKARSHAESQGHAPSAMGGRIEGVLETSVDWRSQLLQYISNEVFSGYNWARRHKRTRAVMKQGVNTTLPDSEKESLNIAVALDTSGSIGEEELKKFLGELCGILNAFESVKLTLIQHTADVYNVETFDSPNESQFAELDIASGGTDHRPVFQELENRFDLNTDLLVAFTDGYTTVPETEPFGMDTVWAVDNHNVGLDQLNFGRILRIDDL